MCSSSQNCISRLFIEKSLPLSGNGLSLVILLVKWGIFYATKGGSLVPGTSHSRLVISNNESYHERKKIRNHIRKTIMS